MSGIICGWIMMTASGLAGDADTLSARLQQLFAPVEGTFAVAVYDLRTGFEFGMNERETFHAASTMKTPVMIEIFRQAWEGAFRLDDSVDVRNEFRSIVDGSLFRLDLSDDSDDALYGRIGGKATIRELVDLMITVSSNLATNILIELVGAPAVTQTMQRLGATDIRVLRGVEDDKAYAAGENNTTTARDLAIIYRALAERRAVDRAACDEMINVLLRQKFRELIPAQLPEGVTVAHKTGSITGVQHDSGIVFRPDGSAYVVILLSKGLKDAEAGRQALAAASRIIYETLSTP